METQQAHDEGCAHCRYNPKGKKPYAKMKHFRFTELTQDQRDKIGKPCFLCRTVQGFIDALEKQNKT